MALLRAARPAHWTKNLLVFAGIVFSENVGEASAWGRTLLTFAAFCAASSAAYLANDVVDAEYDRAHPVKQRRPIASGQVGRASAIVAAWVLGLASLAVAGIVGAGVAGLLAGFLALQALYTGALKRVPIVDALVISALFIVRAAAGAVAIDVRLSPWLVVCTGLLALFLALGKRRAELLLVHADETPGRPVLEGYSLELVDQLMSIAAAATISAYSIYTFTATGSNAMMLTIPFVVFGILRYLYLLHLREVGEEPEQLMLRDTSLLLNVAGWAATATVILLLSD